MTNTDKTRQQLVDSIRKSKQAAGEDKPPTAKKRVRTRKTGAKSVKKTTPSRADRGSVDTTPGAPDDSYQGGRRVWPD